MARSEAAKRRQGGGVINGRQRNTGTTKERGQYGNTRPRDDQSVRRSREVENDPRLQRAKAELEEHERKLAALDAELAHQPHTPYRPEPDPVALETARHLHAQIAAADEMARGWFPPSTTPQTPARRSRLQDPLQVQEATELLAQGYHINRVVARTGVAPEALRRLVADDGYAR